MQPCQKALWSPMSIQSQQQTQISLIWHSHCNVWGIDSTFCTSAKHLSFWVQWPKVSEPLKQMLNSWDSHWTLASEGGFHWKMPVGKPSGNIPGLTTSTSITTHSSGAARSCQVSMAFLPCDQQSENLGSSALTQGWLLDPTQVTWKPRASWLQKGFSHASRLPATSMLIWGTLRHSRFPDS